MCALVVFAGKMFVVFGKEFEDEDAEEWLSKWCGSKNCKVDLETKELVVLKDGYWSKYLPSYILAKETIYINVWGLASWTSLWI